LIKALSAQLCRYPMPLQGFQCWIRTATLSCAQFEEQR